MNTKEIYERIAKENHTTSSVVREEMQKAIKEGFLNPDPKIQKEWKKIKISGEIPTPEELLSYMVGCIFNN